MSPLLPTDAVDESQRPRLVHWHVPQSLAGILAASRRFHLLAQRFLAVSHPYGNLLPGLAGLAAGGGMHGGGPRPLFDNEVHGGKALSPRGVIAVPNADEGFVKTLD